MLLTDNTHQPLIIPQAVETACKGCLRDNTGIVVIKNDLRKRLNKVTEETIDRILREILYINPLNN